MLKLGMVRRYSIRSGTRTPLALSAPNNYTDSGLRSDVRRWLLAGDGEFFSCDLCDYRTPIQMHFQRHLTKHATNRPHTCNVCGDAFKMKCHLAIHMHRHVPKSSVKKKYKMAKKMIPKRPASPAQTSPTAAERKKFECRECSFKTGIRRSLLVHQDAHRCSRKLKCKFCDYITLNRSNLLVHEARHLSQVPVDGTAPASLNNKKQVHKCRVCGYASKYAGRLATHQKSHIVVVEPSNGTASPSNEDTLKPFRCDLCGDCFKLRGSLTNHVNAHRRNVMLKCTSCPRMFKTKSGLLAHAEEHSEAPVPVPRDDDAVPEERQGALGPMSPTGFPNGGGDLGERGSVPVVGRVYCCLVCPAELSSRQSLANHMASDHDVPHPASRPNSFYS